MGAHTKPMGNTSYTILIAEDETTLLDMYTAKFESEGHKVVSTLNGEKVVELAKEHEPDIILLDIMMPIVDGYEALKALKDEDTTRNVPVFLLTNLGQKSEIDKGLLLGADDYLVKVHFTLPEILKKIDTFFEKRGE